MQYQNIAFNGPYIGLFSLLIHIGSNRLHKTYIFKKLHPQIAKNVEKQGFFGHKIPHF